MRRTTRRFGRRFRRAKKELIWVSTLTEYTTVLSSGLSPSLVILNRNDWCRDPAQLTTIEKGAVLLRVVGDVIVEGPVGEDVQAMNVLWGLLKRDEDDSTVLDITTNWFGEDWMHLEMGSVATITPSSSTPTMGAGMQRWRVDSRVKRKLTSEDTINFEVAVTASDASATRSALISHFFRCLVQLP